LLAPTRCDAQKSAGLYRTRGADPGRTDRCHLWPRGARLIYLGVAHTLSDDEDTRLVVDIGGGSTEFILGERFEPLRLESLQMGCVSYGEAFFPDGKITKERFDAAYHRARIEVSHIRRNYHSESWQEAVAHLAHCAPLKR
jgi:exopolyphosphatase/pppGpp-phosphohydrolase